MRFCAALSHPAPPLKENRPTSIVQIHHHQRGFKRQTLSSDHHKLQPLWFSRPIDKTLGSSRSHRRSCSAGGKLPARGFLELEWNLFFFFFSFYKCSGDRDKWLVLCWFVCEAPTAVKKPLSPEEQWTQTESLTSTERLINQPHDEVLDLLFFFPFYLKLRESWNYSLHADAEGAWSQRATACGRCH